MSISGDIIRGDIEAVILSNLVNKDSYGYEINKRIKLCSDGKYEVNESTLYTAFKKLEDSGLIISYWGTEATNARRKYYHITEKGIEMQKILFSEWETAKEIIDKLLLPEGNL